MTVAANNTKIFVFDVDGVIFDSTDECLVTAWNAYQDFIGQTNFVTRPEEAPSDYVTYFRSMRSYNRVADEYLVVFFSKEGEIKSLRDYEKKLGELPANEQEKFGKFFFKQRKILKTRDMKAWLNLHRIYPGIVDLIRLIKSLFSLRVVTGKDKESVLDFFHLFEVPIDMTDIYDKSAAKNKMAALIKISQEEKVPFSNIYFLDDNASHLLKPKTSGIKVMMASWGYSLPEYREMANTNGIPIVSIPQLQMAIKQEALNYV